MLEVFYRKEQSFNFKKLNIVECTNFKIIISILNSLACIFKTPLKHMLHLPVKKQVEK